MGVEKDTVGQAVEAGLADIEAGHYATIVTEEDAWALHARLLDRVRAGLIADP